MDDLPQALAIVIDAAKEAGAILRADFHRPTGPRGAHDHADADEEAERIIQQRLLAAFPWNYRGEECGSVRAGDPRFCWLVDPNDGTASYLKGLRGSAVSIALLRDSVPVLGVVYAFCYPDADGDLIAWAEGCPLTRNGLQISGSLAGGRLEQTAAAPIVFVSQDADKHPAGNAECVAPARYIALPSIAYRLARVAAGDGLAAVSLNGPRDWDYGAGHALLRAAGGILVNEAGSEVTYTQDGRSYVSHCFGGSPAVVQELCKRDWKKVRAGTSHGSPPFCLVRPVPGHAVVDSGRLSRAQGCLLGQLAGDALGGLVEFQSPERILRQYPHGVRDLQDGGCWGNLAGQPTDDSEMALMLARTLVHEGQYHRGAALDAYVNWWPTAWDRGSTLGQALSPASRASATADRLVLVYEHASQSSQSNGCLMHISPLGIFGAGRPVQAAGWAREDCGLTHPHPVCQDSCAVFVAAIATAIVHGGTAQDSYMAALAEAERSQVQASVRQSLESALDAPPGDFLTHQGWVLIALQNAFYQLLHAATLEEGLVDTVIRGGDTDTNAAIAGALLGAMHGREQVPRRWRLTLECCRPQPPKVAGRNAHPRPPEFWPVDALALAESLLWAGQMAS